MKLFEKGLYRVVENPLVKDAAIELLEGEWKGLVYQYGKVQFEDGKPNINFQRTIRRLPNDVEKTEEEIEKLLNNNNLQSLMGDILIEILQEEIKNEQRITEGTNKET